MVISVGIVVSKGMSSKHRGEAPCYQKLMARSDYLGSKIDLLWIYLIIDI